MVTDNAHLLALSRHTGEKLWDVEMGAVKDSYSATSAPLIAGDLVISGVAGGEEGARGFVDAYRAIHGRARLAILFGSPNAAKRDRKRGIGSALEHGCGAT